MSWRTRLANVFRTDRLATDLDDELAFHIEERVDELDLLDWKRHVFALYAGVRASADPELAWRGWRAARDELFRTHPQSPLPEQTRAGFTGLPYFDYDPAMRVLAEAQPAEEPRK